MYFQFEDWESIWKLEFKWNYWLNIAITPSLFLCVFLISSLRRIASHVFPVTIAMLWGSRGLQENAGKVSTVWEVQIALTLLWVISTEGHAQKVIRTL